MRVVSIGVVQLTLMLGFKRDFNEAIFGLIFFPQFKRLGILGVSLSKTSIPRDLQVIRPGRERECRASIQNCFVSETAALQ